MGFMSRKLVLALGFIFLSLFCLMSCGLEEYAYIDYIPDANVTMTDVTRATIRLPSSGADGYGNYFDNFIIFYRIYISGDNPTGTILTADQRSAINPTLNFDYNNILSTTDKNSTTVNTSNLESFFYTRNYYQLTLEGPNISTVLNSGSLGKTLEIDFPYSRGVEPTLNLGTTVDHILLRADTGPGMSFSPLPDNYYFLNHPDLYSNANASDKMKNADVAGRTITSPPNRYTYVSMYIAAAGKSFDSPPRNLYSQPTFIGIFMLAESSDSP